MKALILLFALLASNAYSSQCEKWEYGLLYLSYTHDGEAKQQWESNGKMYNWLEGIVKKTRYSESNDAKLPMAEHFGFDRKIILRLDNLDAIGNKGWELISERISNDNRATYYFKKCKTNT